MTRTTSSSGRSSSGRSSSSRSSSSRTTITPKPSSIPPLPIPSIPLNKTELSNKSNSGGFLSAIKEGFGFGFGSSIAHRVVGGIFGSSSTYSHTTKIETPHYHHNTHETPDISKSEYIPKPECKSLQEEYLKCIQSSNTEFHSGCEFMLNSLKNCEDDYKTFN